MKERFELIVETLHHPDSGTDYNVRFHYPFFMRLNGIRWLICFVFFSFLNC